jgi:DNA-binding PadR family transcriptional regulator
MPQVPQKSALAVAVLAFLAEEPMHAYRMQQLIRQRAKDSVVNVAQRNSIYQTISRLQRLELIKVHKTHRVEGRPERVTYEISEEGTAVLQHWMKEMVAVPAAEFPEFPAALAFLPILSHKDAVRQLKSRLAALEQRLAEAVAGAKAAQQMGLPRLFLIEDEYQQAMLRTELSWVRSLIADMESGEITWNVKWLRKLAAEFAAKEG